MEKCSNCKFYLETNEQLPEEGDYSFGVCRRRLIVGESFRTLSEWTSTVGGFLNVNEHSWCGEWEPKGNSYALVIADWLEEKDFHEAANTLRKEFDGGEKS